MKNFKSIFAKPALFFAVAWISSSAFGQSVGHGISAAYIQVSQVDTNNATNSVTLSMPTSINGMTFRNGSSRGDYFLQVGSTYGDDASTGIMMSSIAENGRDNGETAFPGANFCTPSIAYTRTGGNAEGYYVSSCTTPSGAEYNINMAAAFFPYSNWIGGIAENSGSTNGGANDLFIGSPGLELGTHYIDNGGGISTVDLTSLGIDSRTDGVLLVSFGKNEDNYALSQVNTNGTWTIYSKDNGTDAGSYEQDPVAFVFIPKTNTTVVSGRFRGDGTRLMFSGATPQFTVTNTSVGTWHLTIPGYSPANGVLIISAEGGLNQNQDNIVSYQNDDDGWIIQSRDLPGNPPGLQTPGTGTEPVASFVFIPATASLKMISPTNNAGTVSVSPELKVSISNNVPGNLSVKFYGRLAPTNLPNDFTLIALPDTQYYTDEKNGAKKEMFTAQTEWIISNRVSMNISYVVHLGDIVDHGDNNGGSPATEWQNATNSMYRLENPIRTLLNYGIPYGTAVGNHDQSPNGSAVGTTIFFNQYFGIQHFSGLPYYAGHYGTNNDNHFDFFSAGGMDFITLYFEYDTNANPAVIEWGNNVLKTNANRRAIVVTHYTGSPSTPSTFSVQAAAIYKGLKTNANFFLMLGGHVNGEGSRVDTFNGNTVHSLISDYQFRTNGGNGELRIMTFSPANNQITIQSYSPWTGEYETDANSEFFFSYNMDQPSSTNVAPFVLLNTVTNVSPGSFASFVWSNRQVNAEYEWYAVVTDASGNSLTGPTWQFTTAANLAPTATNSQITLIGDAPTNLFLPGSDPNGDRLTFTISSFPNHGLIQNFQPDTGEFIFLPVRGFRGIDRVIYKASDGSLTSPVATLNLNVVAPSDTNANTLPDAWENAFRVSDPNGDDDHDGFSNLSEYFANTNPTNAASTLRISQATRAENGHVTLAWPTVGGTRYRVQYSDGGTNGTFTGIFNDAVRPLSLEMNPVPYGSAATQTFVDDFSITGVPTNTVRYYRLKIVP